MLNNSWLMRWRNMLTPRQKFDEKHLTFELLVIRKDRKYFDFVVLWIESFSRTTTLFYWALCDKKRKRDVKTSGNFPQSRNRWTRFCSLNLTKHCFTDPCLLSSFI